MNGNSITLVDSLGNVIAGTFSFTNNNLSVVFDPSVDLSPNTTYTLSALEGIKTLSGNRLSSTFTLSFTTGAISVAQYTIGGTVSGLVGSVTLQNNSTDTLTLTTNGNFTFSNALNSGSSYSVSILTQPSGQTCSVSNGSGSLTANVTNVTVSCINNVATTLPTASYPWGTFTDMGNGTVRFVGVAGVFGGQTYTADTLYFAKCSKDQTWDSVNNTCTGTVGQARYCSSANNSCNDSTTLQLNGTGTSQAWDYCNSLNLAGRSWRVPTKNELKLTIQCTNQTILSSDDGSSCASSPAINTNLFPNTATANCRYWTATASSSSNAWFINYCTGVAISNNNKDAFNYIRCVSTGP